MNTNNLVKTLFFLSAILILFGCQKSEVSMPDKIEKVLIVYEDNYKLIGEILFSLSGELLYSWAPDNIVIFRVNKKVGDEIGEKGMIYFINDYLKLVNIGKADLSKTDLELAGKYHVNTDASVTINSVTIGY